MMIRWPALGLIALSTVPIFLAGCDDLLPEYRPPEKVFEASFVSADTHTVKFTASFADEYFTANYNIYFAEPTVPFSVAFTVKNIYEETIQMNATIGGSISLWPEANPAFQSVHELTATNIVGTSAYNPATNTIVLNPGQEMFVTCKINFRLSQGPYLHKFADEISRVIVSQSGRSCYEIMYAPVRVGIRMTMQLSERFPAVTAEQSFPVKLQGIIIIPF